MVSHYGLDDRSGSSPAACPRRGERPESARKTGVRGGWGELPDGVVSRHPFHASVLPVACGESRPSAGGPTYSGRLNTSSGSKRPRTGWKPSETRGREQTRAKALETRIGRNSFLVRPSIR